MSKLPTRKVGGYLILASLFGGYFGMMAYDLGLTNALIIVGLLVVFWLFLTLAIYLIMEN